jgi:hypothetical protein
MKWSLKHYELMPHHKYQLEVVLLFVFGFFLYIPYFILMDELSLEKQVYQWYFFWPWMVFYVLYSLNTRRRIKPLEKTMPLRRPIVHWVLLGITLIAFHLQPGDLQQLQSVDLMFAIFSLFLADSYWDFRNIRKG